MNSNQFKPYLKYGLLSFCTLILLLLGCGIIVDMPNDLTGAPGERVFLPVTVDRDLDPYNVVAYKATISFDQNVLQPIGGVHSGTLTENWGSPAIDITNAGTVTIAGFGTTLVTEENTMFFLEFEVVGQPGDTTLIHFDKFTFNIGDPGANINDYGRFIVVN